ncbi:Anti-sigma-B factor antagonist [Nonomuraea coxensis DSM 45129]|uniref:Anti-sigma factor antagonist n=1 Tax=Nonomuraea coxensis DSM 45129 TaxID=1122611 RepID=A0ABX8UFT0_9ACTN|nr:STAS domain-containing protein [Nonomuraea coxensis]QYC45586.1 Anti-sigma-B factor antagonist [Nonomuraea coxensis DSM 45129]
MKLTCRHLPGVTLITVSGPVDATNSAELESFVDGARRRLDEHLVFDLGEVSFLDSSGLAVLLAAATLARAHGVAVHLAAVQERPIRIMEITGAWRAVHLYDRVDQALAAAGAGPSPRRSGTAP